MMVSHHYYDYGCNSMPQWRSQYVAKSCASTSNNLILSYFTFTFLCRVTATTIQRKGYDNGFNVKVNFVIAQWTPFFLW